MSDVAGDQDSSPSVAFHPTAARRAVLFGPFRFDLSDKTLTRDGEEVRLPPRALLILAYFVERPNRVVGKQELIDTVWKDAFVGETSLTEAIGVLRQALGDSASEPGFIQTVHRRGYRFVAPLRIETQAAAPLATASLADVPAEQAVVTAVGLPPRVWRVVAGIIALTGVIAAVAWLAVRNEPAAQVTRATVTLPAGQAPAPGLTAQPVAALSPDGRRIVYVAGAPGSYRLFLRSIDQFEAVPIPGTDGGHGAFFSPDGSAIGYFARGRLFVLQLPDGQPIDLAPSGSGHGGWWHTDGTIVFATGVDAGLFRVPARGGAPTPIAVQGRNAALLRHPSVMDDGRTLLATEWKYSVRQSEIVAIDLASGAARTLGRGVHARALPDGLIAFLRDNDLIVAAAAGGAPETTLISGVMTGLTTAGQYSIAANGTLLYLADSPDRLLRQMLWLTPDGVEQPLPFEPRAFQNLLPSPDGRSVVATIYERGASDLWVGDTSRGVLQRLTSEGGSIDPIWARDGHSIFFSSTRQGRPSIYRIAADGGTPPTLVSSVSPLTPTSATASGVLFASRLDMAGGSDIVRIAPDGTVTEWLATAALEGAARISPDEQKVVYHSNRSGRQEIYLRNADGSGAERQVSLDGGVQPGWSADGRSIYYFFGRRVFRTGFRNGALSRPEQIYLNDRLVQGRAGDGGVLILKAIEEEKPLTTLNLVIGWTGEVRVRINR